MANKVKRFKELTPELQSFAGGKGGMLAKMSQAGYPIPEGFVILPENSFAGEFETVLNVQSDEEVVEAIDTVFKSRTSERVNSYNALQGMEQSHQMAVVSALSPLKQESLRVLVETYFSSMPTK